jgi:predicted membrane-bound mannosyltransferase
VTLPVVGGIHGCDSEQRKILLSSVVKLTVFFTTERSAPLRELYSVIIYGISAPILKRHGTCASATDWERNGKLSARLKRKASSCVVSRMLLCNRLLSEIISSRSEPNHLDASSVTCARDRAKAGKKIDACALRLCLAVNTQRE